MNGVGKNRRLKGGRGEGELRDEEREVRLLLCLPRIWRNLASLLLGFLGEIRGQGEGKAWITLSLLTQRITNLNSRSWTVCKKYSLC